MALHRRWRQMAARQRSHALGSALAFLVLGAACSRAAGAPSVNTLLRRLIVSSRAVNLRGKQVTLSMAGGADRRPCIQKVVRRSDGRSLTVCLEPSTQRGAATMDDGVWRKSWDPHLRRLTISRSMVRSLDEHDVRRMLRLIRRNYRVAIETKEIFSDRMCYRMAFTPHSLTSHPMRVWIDAARGVVLGHQESDWQTNTVSLAFFATSDYPRRIPLSDVTFRVPRKARLSYICRSGLVRNIADLRREAGFEIAVPRAMPGGYEFEHAELLSVSGRPTVCLHYTDGIANISIFQSRAPRIRPAGYRELAPTHNPAGDVVGIQYACGTMDYVVLGHGELAGMMAVAQSLNVESERARLKALARTYHVAPDSLAALRNAGIGVDAIHALLHIATTTGRPLRLLAELYQDGWSWASIAEHMGLDAATIRLHLQRVRGH